MWRKNRRKLQRLVVLTEHLFVFRAWFSQFLLKFVFSFFKKAIIIGSTVDSVRLWGRTVSRSFCLLISLGNSIKTWRKAYSDVVLEDSLILTRFDCCGPLARMVSTVQCLSETTKIAEWTYCSVRCISHRKHSKQCAFCAFGIHRTRGAWPV